MSINALAILLIFLAIGARVLFSHLLVNQKKAFEAVLADLRKARGNLQHEKERREAAEQVLRFHMRRKDELPHLIREKQEDLEKLEKEEEEEGQKEGEEGKSEEEKKEDRHEIGVSGRRRKMDEGS